MTNLPNELALRCLSIAKHFLFDLFLLQFFRMVTIPRGSAGPRLGWAVFELLRAPSLGSAQPGAAQFNLAKIGSYGLGSARLVT